MAGQAENSGSGTLTHGGLTGGLTGGPGAGSHRYCGSCAGLIPELGVSYGYAGKFCHCPRQAHGEIFPSKDLQDWARELERKRKELMDKQMLTAPPPVPASLTVPPTMTPHDFVLWMRGFFAGRSAAPTDPQLEFLLRSILDKVKS